MSNPVKHTPGPWQVVPTAFNEGYTVLAQPNAVLRGFSKPVAYIGDKLDAEVEANARLIAAAPDLLAALKRCEAMVSSDQGSPNWDWVREVISKAEGRP